MALSARGIREARPGKKPYKLYDGYGLFLQVRPSGGKLWRYKYKFGGKEKLMALGPYPVVPLAMARERHLEARQLLVSGVDPMAQRKEEKAGKCAVPPQAFGRSQRAEFRFTPDEVYVHRDPATGDLILSLALKNWKEIFAALDEAGLQTFLQDRDQGEYEKREPLDGPEGYPKPTSRQG